MTISSPIPANLIKVVQKSGYTVLVLQAGAKEIAIFVENGVGEQIQHTLLGEERPRPSTLDLLDRVLRCHDIELHGVLIHDLSDGVYRARLITQQERAGLLRTVGDIDCRPSDALQLALRHQSPLWILPEVLAQAPDATDCEVL